MKKIFESFLIWWREDFRWWRMRQWEYFLAKLGYREIIDVTLDASWFRPGDKLRAGGTTHCLGLVITKPVKRDFWWEYKLSYKTSELNNYGKSNKG